MNRLPLFVASVALALATTSLSAQSTSAPAAARHGFFAGGGLGLGSAQVTCGTSCGTNGENGLSGYAHAGGTINPHFRVGIESNGWVHSENGVDENVAFYTAAAWVYPSVSNNLWLKAGVGYATAKASDDVDELKATGVGISAAIGYDWAVTRGNFVVIPFAGYLRLLNGTAKYDGTDMGVNATVELFQFGIGLGFRH